MLKGVSGEFGNFFSEDKILAHAPSQDDEAPFRLGCLGGGWPRLGPGPRQRIGGER